MNCGRWIRKIAAALSAFLLLCCCKTAYAEVEWYQMKDGNPVRLGGVNQIDRVVCQSEEETRALEERLRRENYILVTTDDKEISDEDFELLRQANPPYSEFFDRESEFNWDMKMEKVYMYVPSYNDAMEQLRAGRNIDSVTRVELTTSTVVLSYAMWYFKERAGTVVNEFNDNIPSWYTRTGFLQIISPIDAVITLDCWQEHTRNVFYVRANEPFLVKVKASMHAILSVNTKEDVSLEEESLKLNRFVVRVENTEDDPCVMDITEFVTKYDIKPADISGKPDYSWTNKDNPDASVQESLPVESAVVQDEENQESGDNKLLWRIFFAGLWLAVIAAAVIAVCVIKKKYRKGER